MAVHILRRSGLLATAGLVAIAAGALPSSTTAARAAAPLPCDIYGSSGAPCVAADSSVRALHSTYNGSLYRVVLASDGAATDVGVDATGGYANAGYAELLLHQRFLHDHDDLRPVAGTQRPDHRETWRCWPAEFRGRIVGSACHRGRTFGLRHPPASARRVPAPSWRRGRMTTRRRGSSA